MKKLKKQASKAPYEFIIRTIKILKFIDENPSANFDEISNSFFISESAIKRSILFARQSGVEIFKSPQLNQYKISSWGLFNETYINDMEY